MIYLDSSVALAQLLSEDRRPRNDLWAESLVSSRLLEFEIMNVLRTRGHERTHESLAKDLLSRIGLLELIPEVVGSTRRKAGTARTLDTLHLASAAFLMENGVDIQLASFDARMLDGARKFRIPVYRL